MTDELTDIFISIIKDTFPGRAECFYDQIRDGVIFEINQNKSISLHNKFYDLTTSLYPYL